MHASSRTRWKPTSWHAAQSFAKNACGREIVPLVTSGPPGVTGFAGGRPKATEIISYWPALIGKDKDEHAVALSSATGEELWRVRIDGKFTNRFGNGPRSTPAVADGLVFALSAGGKLSPCSLRSTTVSVDVRPDAGILLA